MTLAFAHQKCVAFVLMYIPEPVAGRMPAEGYAAEAAWSPLDSSQCTTSSASSAQTSAPGGDWPLPW